MGGGESGEGDGNDPGKEWQGPEQKQQEYTWKSNKDNDIMNINKN